MTVVAYATIMIRNIHERINMIPKDWRKDLLKMADKACKHLDIEETTLGNKIFNDADFFPKIRNGSGCGVDRYQRVIAWFDKNLPRQKSQQINQSNAANTT